MSTGSSACQRLRHLLICVPSIICPNVIGSWNILLKSKCFSNVFLSLISVLVWRLKSHDSHLSCFYYLLGQPPESKEIDQLSLEDLETIKVIGKGSGGVVQLVRHKWVGTLFALKVLILATLSAMHLFIGLHYFTLLSPS